MKKSIDNDKKSIHLCAYLNQAVENIVKFISLIVKALGKKMVWIPRKGMEFETKTDFDEATEEEKNLSIFKILNRNTKEAKCFKKLQEIKWDLNLKMKNFKQAMKNHINYREGKPRRFSLNEQKMMDDLRFLIERNLIYESDVVCSTLLSSARNNMIDFKFDYVFIDEASQANQPCSIVPLVHHPSKLVLLGDHKQLDVRLPDVIKERHPETSMSLYRKLIKNGIQHEMLTVQFRMHPLICEFPNNEFYHGRIKNAPDMAEKTFIELQNIPTPIVFIDVKDGREKKVLGTTYRNVKEALAVEKIINNFKKNRIDAKDVGVITPYHGQVHLLRHKINKIGYNGLRISSVDIFQGSERDFIVLSLVRTNEQGQFGFLPDKHRINVALTRARKGLIIIGNFSAILTSNDTGMHSENQFLVDLCKFYKDKNALIDVNDPRIEKIDVFVEKKKTNKLVINMVDTKPKENEEDQEIKYASDSIN